MMNISAIAYDLDTSYDGKLPDILANVLTESHPTVAFWSDETPFSTAMRICVLALTSVLQFSTILDLRSFPRAVVFLVFQNLSSVTTPEFPVLPHPKTRVVFLTNDQMFNTSIDMKSYEISFEILMKFSRTKFVWFNVNEEVHMFTIISTSKSTKMEIVEISSRDAIRKLKEPARLTKIPNFHGEEIVITLINNSIYSKLEPWVNSSGSGWRVGGFHALYMEKVCKLMNLSIVYKEGDWYGRFENGTFTPGIYKDLIARKMDASPIGAFLRYEAVGLVEYSNPWRYACVRYLVPRPKLLSTTSSVFVNVFSLVVWLLIAVTVLVSTCVATLAVKISHPSHKYYRNIGTAAMRLWFHLLQCQYPTRAEYSNSMVPLLVSWGWMGFVLTAMYSSELAATFTSPAYGEKIQTESQFIEHGYTWGSYTTLDRILHFDMSDPATYKWVTEFNNEGETEEERERRMRNGKYVVVGLSYGDVFFFREQMSPPTDITDNYEVADKCSLEKHIGILFSLGSPYLEGVNLITRRLLSGGILQKFEYNEMMKNPAVPLNVFSLSAKDMKNVAGYTRLSLSVFYGPIYLLVSGYLISTSVLILHEGAYRNVLNFFRQHH